VGLLFAVSALPGWHATVLPPFFVFGAAFSGFAVVTMIAVTVRHAFRVKGVITERHIDLLAKALLGTGLATSYGYLMELFGAYYSGEPFEQALMLDRLGGPYAWSYWAVILCNAVLIQALWSSTVRRSPIVLFVIAFVVGMWFERFMINVITLHHDFLPSCARFHTPTFWDISTYLGSLGLFLTLFLLFIRYLPIISIFEVREMARPAAEGDSR
jgi:Ni/Fe-hydrogenase subunit HybB-like protein